MKAATEHRALVSSGMVSDRCVLHAHDLLYGRVPNNVWSQGTVLGGAIRHRVVIPVVIAQFHLVGMTTLWRVAV